VTSILPWSLLFGCGSVEPEPEPDITDTTRPTVVAPSVVLLPPAERLNRISMALRGIRPSYEDMLAVEEDPSLIEAIVDGYLDDQEFGVTMRDLHADTLLNRWEGAQVPALEGLEGKGLSEINASMMEEPLQLISHVIMRNRPYTEVVTSDEVMADRTVAAIWGIEYTGDENRDEWSATTWNDGRPGAGVVSSSGFMVAHQSCGINNNRGRANHLSRAFLCHDIAYSAVEVDGLVDISVPDNVLNALESDATCIACHQSLDGLGSYFYGFVTILPPFQTITDVWDGKGPQSWPITFYKPDNEDDWSTDQAAMDTPTEVPYGSDRPPSYFGQTGKDYDDLADLGEAIAADPRFASCAAKRFYAYFHEIDLDAVPIDTVAPLATAFVDEGYDAKQLAKSIVMSDEFAAAYADDAATADELVGMKRIRIEQLGRMIEDLTGFRWIVDSDDTSLGYNPATKEYDLAYEFGEVDVTASDRIGFRTMWGGLDSFWILKPSYTTSPAASLVLRRYAAQAAAHVVEQDFAQPQADRKLLGFVDADTTAEDPIRAQLARLHARIFVELVSPQSDEVERTWLLWKSVYDRTASPTNAWTVTLAAMLQDVKVVHY
jgi:hypothetical protein